MPPDAPRRLLPTLRRVVSFVAGWCVDDADGAALANVLGDNAPEGVNARKLTRDEARRIAVGIARIPAARDAERARLSAQGVGEQTELIWGPFVWTAPDF